MIPGKYIVNNIVQIYHKAQMDCSDKVMYCSFYSLKNFEKIQDDIDSSTDKIQYH